MLSAARAEKMSTSRRAQMRSARAGAEPFSAAFLMRSLSQPMLEPGDSAPIAAEPAAPFAAPLAAPLRAAAGSAATSSRKSSRRFSSRASESTSSVFTFGKPHPTTARATWERFKCLSKTPPASLRKNPTTLATRGFTAASEMPVLL